MNTILDPIAVAHDVRTIAADLERAGRPRAAVRLRDAANVLDDFAHESVCTPEVPETSAPVVVNRGSF